jgi:hypothetical protein
MLPALPESVPAAAESHPASPCMSLCDNSPIKSQVGLPDLSHKRPDDRRKAEPRARPDAGRTTLSARPVPAKGSGPAAAALP